MKFIIASSKSWFHENCKNPYILNQVIEWVREPKDLELNKLKTLNPDYIFFTHWNWKIEAEIYDNYKCIIFHAAPLPYGRGGSPIQNLILEGFTKTPVNALQVNSEIDGGDILLSKEISLEGTLSDIFKRIGYVIEEFIIHISNGTYSKTPQIGEVKYFKRRTRVENAIPMNQNNLKLIYDYIRMLDSPDYPKAYIESGNFRIEFKNAVANQNSIEAVVQIFHIK